MGSIAAVKDYVQFGAKNETAEGTAEPLAAANFIVPAYDVDIRRKSTQAERRPVGLSTSALQSVETNRIAEGKATLECYPSGSATVDPDIFAHLKSSGAASGTGRVLKWGHEASSVVRGSATTFQYENGIWVRKAFGARSTVKFRPNDKGYLVAEHVFQGAYSKASGSFTASVALATTKPLVCPGAVLSLGGSTVQYNDIEINIEGKLNTLEDYSAANLAGQTIIQDHKQTAVVTVFETGTPDWELKAQNLTAGDLAAFSWALGSGTNNIWTFAGTTIITDVTPTFVANAAAFKVTLEFQRNGSTGALTLTQT